MKKLISMLLALTLVLALVPTVFAEGEATTFTWKDFDGTNTDLQTAAGTNLPAYAHVVATDGTLFTARASVGANNPVGISNESADYHHGMKSYLAFPTPIADGTYAVKFEYKRDFDSVARIETRHDGQPAYWHDSSSILIDKNGNVTVQGNKIGNVGANEWHTFVIKSTVSPDANEVTEVYLDGTKFGPYTSGEVYTKGAATNLALCTTAYTCDMIRALNISRSDGRAESLYIKNLVVTNDMSVAFPETLSFYNVKLVSNKAILFSASKDIDVPDAAGVLLGTTAATSTERVASNSFKATFSKGVVPNKTYNYSVTIGGTAYTGSFVARYPEFYETFDAGNQGFIISSILSHQSATRDGKEGYTGDKAFGWASEQHKTAGGGYSTISRNSGNFDWFAYDSATTAPNVSNDRLVISADYMRGNDKVGFIPFAFMLHSRQYHSSNLIEVTPAGEFKVQGTKYRDFGVKEWHNITVHIMISGFGNKMNVYFDGELVASNLTVSAFSTIRTVGENDRQTDAELLTYNNNSTQRNELVIMDNVYVGRDLDYKTSSLTLDNTGKTYSGAISRSGVALTASYSADGAIKDVKVGSYKAAGFTASNIADTTVNATTGDTVKFIIVNDLINLKPLVNATSYVK